MQKLADAGVRRITMTLPEPTLKRIDDWRRKEPDLPNVSEALRRLIEKGLAKPAKQPPT